MSFFEIRLNFLFETGPLTGNSLSRLGWPLIPRICLFLPPWCWNYKQAQPHPDLFVFKDLFFILCVCICECPLKLEEGQTLGARATDMCESSGMVTEDHTGSFGALNN